MILFQSTHPQGVRRHRWRWWRRDWYFNPLTRKGWDKIPNWLHQLKLDFNPLTRKGWDNYPEPYRRWWRISIHSPARGETKDAILENRKIWISIHSPARGETIIHYNTENAYSISIHSPARGETHVFFRSPYLKIISIHSPARGETINDMHERNEEIFQSTHPQGVRRR